MNIVLLVVYAVLGLAVGSFLNVLIYRLNTPRSPKFWQGRSFCPKCERPLSWSDNIPLLSYMVLRGKCRYCHKTISWQYPLVELTTALVTVLVFSHLPPSSSSYSTLLLCYVFLVIFFSDLIYGLIPDEMVYFGSAVAVFVLLITNHQSLINSLVAAILSRFFLLAIVWLTKFKGMGLGDIKLAFLMSLLLGWPKILVAFWLAFILGGIAAVLLLVLKRTKLSATIPLGPFLVLGTLFSALWSEQLLRLTPWSN